jgi:hypothetical protein
MSKEEPWFDSEGRFDIRTCITVRKYVAAKTGLHFDNILAHMTNTFLVVTCAVDGKVLTNKVRTHGTVYVLKQEQLDAIVGAIKTGTVLEIPKRRSFTDEGF